jgi:hypothetical protein
MAFSWLDVTGVDHTEWRFGHAICWYPPGGGALMFGGQSLTLAVTATTNSYVNEVWTSLSPSTTPTSEFPTGIAGLKQHEIVYDPLKQRAIMIGGITGQDYGPNTNAVYVYKGDFSTGDWNLEIADGTGGMPAKRHNFAMSVDTDRNELIIFGGRTAGNAQDTWVVDLNDDPLTVGSFTEIFPVTKPGHRQFGQMWYNPINQLTYLFGGNGNGGGWFHDLFTWDGTAQEWTDITPAGGDQIDTTHNWDTADVVWVPGRGKAIICGRVPNGSGDKAEAWELTHDPPATAVWTLVADGDIMSPSPPARKFHSNHWDPIAGYWYYSMGDNGFIGNPEEDTWRLNVPATIFPPLLQNQDPAADATNVSTSTDISLDIIEQGGSAITDSSVIITFDGDIAWQNDAEQAGFSVTKTVLADGLRFVIDPDVGLISNTLYSVRVEAASGSEELDETYSFTTAPPTSAFFLQQFTVTLAEAVDVLTPRVAWNQFDEHGNSISLARLRGETNWEYKRRILDVFSHQANSSYKGMIHGITRGLGLSLFQPISIWTKLDPQTNQFAAPDPYIKFDGVYLHLYSDFESDELVSINRYQPGGNYEHITRLVDIINTSVFFGAAIEPGIDPYTRSMTILNQSNRVQFSEDIQRSTKFKLEKDKLVSGSVRFSDDSFLTNEVASEDRLARSGDYYIDYWNGIIAIYVVPSFNVVIYYDYIEDSFKPWASPIILHSVSNENFRAAMFDQILQDNGTFAHGLPTRLGSDIINELLSIVPLYWGI